MNFIFIVERYNDLDMISPIIWKCSECKNANVYTIFGRNDKKIDALSVKYKIKNKFKNYQELLKDKNIDLISISLPPSFNCILSEVIAIF